MHVLFLPSFELFLDVLHIDAVATRENTAYGVIARTDLGTKPLCISWMFCDTASQLFTIEKACSEYETVGRTIAHREMK